MDKVTSDDKEARWHVGKEIPIAMILTIAIQTAGIIWWAAGINSRVDMLERQVSSAGWQAEKIIRIDEKLANVQMSVAEVKELIKEQSQRRVP